MRLGVAGIEFSLLRLLVRLVQLSSFIKWRSYFIFSIELRNSLLEALASVF